MKVQKKTQYRISYFEEQFIAQDENSTANGKDCNQYEQLSGKC